MKHQGRFWVWISLSGVAAGVILEVGLRLAFGLGNPILIQADPTIGYLFQPNQHKVRFGKTIQINQFSQRSQPISQTKPTNTLRILMTGDSILNGGTLTQQDRTITALLEQQLQQAGYPAEVLNASAGSWGIGNQLAYLQKFGFFESDILIITIGDNDLTQPTSTSYRVGRSPDYPDRPPVLAIQELIHRYLWSRTARYLKISLPSEIPSSADPTQQAKQNQQLLKQLILLAKSQNLPILVLLIPQRHNLLPTFQIPIEKSNLLDTLKSLNTPVIDFQTIWSKLPEATVKTYFRDTNHLTQTGNQAISLLTFQKLCVNRKILNCAPRASD